MENQLINEIKEVAERSGATLTVDVAKDGAFIDCLIRKGAVDLDVGLPKHDGAYVAYSIESTGLPRELYYNLRKGFTEQERSEEIIRNVDKMLSGTIHFYQKPRLFNKEAGYILLPIDGKQCKIPQKRNSFSLPVVQG